MTRTVLLLIVTIAVALTSFAGAARAQTGPPPADGQLIDSEAPLGEGDDSACDGLAWVVKQVCEGIGSALTSGIQPVVAGGARAVLNEVVGFVVNGAGWLLDRVASFLDTSTRPQLTSGWFERSYRDMTAIAVLGLLPFLLLAIIQSIVRQDLALLLRVSFGYVPLAAIGTAAAVVVVDLLVEVTDVLSAWVGRSLGADLAEFTTVLGEALVVMTGGAAGLAALLGAGLVGFAAFVIWLELLLRQAAIYVAVLFLPLGFMAMVWPATAHWLRRLVQGLVAIILSKFVIGLPPVGRTPAYAATVDGSGRV